MKSRATKHSVYGVLVAAFAVVIATFATGFFQSGELDLDSFTHAHRSNAALWILDLMPFVFAFWGQYVGTVWARNVKAIVKDHTAQLVQKTEALERQAMHDATHDPMTDLPNRLLLRDRLEQALLSMQRGQQLVGLLVLDLDRFKEVNDTLGHYTGDRLLKQIAVRLREVVFKTDTLSRLGGDEFAVLLPALAREEDVFSVVNKIQRAFATPFSLNKMNLDVQASIGVAIAPNHGRDVESLMQRAEVAMYVAKEDKRHFYVYDVAMDKYNSRRLSLLAQLRQAITSGDLRLHYQPKVVAATGQVTSVEALVRWEHEKFGMVRPDEFIHLAEQSGLITELSRWVLRTAVDQALTWLAGGTHLGVAVNLSPSTLLDPEFPDFMAGITASVSLPPGILTLEITESSLVRDPDLALEVLEQLAGMGIAISIDDFGTGYSSLAYLKRMPASELKIDRTFVGDMLHDDSDAAIVRATIELAHNLGMTVVAEGVEDQETVDALTRLGCDALQGFHFSRPVPVATFDQWLQAWDDQSRCHRTLPKVSKSEAFPQWSARRDRHSRAPLTIKAP